MFAVLYSAVVGSSSISSSSSTRSSGDSGPAINPAETAINGSPVVAVGMPLATVSTVATGHQSPVMVSCVHQRTKVKSNLGRFVWRRIIKNLISKAFK